jgi:RimJ/RimL family protein N-acetyltransferase
MTVGFRRLTETDLPLLYEWLQREHVQFWWRERESYDAVVRRYLPAIEGGEPTDLYLILVDDRPAGFIQTYLVSDHPDYQSLVGVEEGVAGVDLFVADPEQTGKGLGSTVIAQFVRDVVFAAPQIHACIADPDAENHASLRAFEKAGFTRVRDFVERRQPPAHAGPDRTLGRQPLDDPVAVRAPVAQAVVHAVVAVLPELVRLRDEPVPAPVLGPSQVVSLMFAGQRSHALIELRPRRQDRALLGRRRSELCSARTGGEVRVGFLPCDSFDRALDPHLPAELQPVEEQGSTRVRVQLGRLPARIAGEEDKAALVGSFQEDHPDGRGACGSGGRKRHRLRGPAFGGSRLREPAPELLERVCGEV